MFDREAPSVYVGQLLRQLRDERGISIRELSRISGLSANALSMIERGLTSPSVSTLYRLTDALNVPITALFRQDQAATADCFSIGLRSDTCALSFGRLGRTGWGSLHRQDAAFHADPGKWRREWQGKYCAHGE